MKEKSTRELDRVISGTHLEKVDCFIKKHESNFINEEKEFPVYMRQLFKEKGMKQQEIFLKADISERYGYKLIAGYKHTLQRDVILRICYAAGFTLPETQRALKIYGMRELYSRSMRDAVLMIAFNERPGGIVVCKNRDSVTDKNNDSAIDKNKDSSSTSSFFYVTMQKNEKLR